MRISDWSSDVCSSDLVVLEFDGGFTEGFNDDYRFYRRAARAVYDEPESYRRWSAGDLRLDNTGMLRTPFIGGVAVEKSRRTFDPFAPTLNLGVRQIFVASPSRSEERRVGKESVRTSRSRGRPCPRKNHNENKQDHRYTTR